MCWSGLVDMHSSTRRHLGRHPFYLHPRRRLGEAPPHREVSFAVVLPVHGGAMGWPGLGDMVHSMRRRRRGARRVTSPRRNHGGGATLDESR